MKVHQSAVTAAHGGQEGREAGRDDASSGAAVASPWAPIEVREWKILTTLGGQEIPLTLRQLHAKTGVPLADLQMITNKLCTAGSIRRLNTVIETFLARAREREDLITPR